MASPPNPTANPNSLASRDIAYHLHPYTNQSLFPEQGPIIITHGEGIKVFDEDGKAYIEGMAGLWCANLGMGNQARMLKAVTRQLERLPYYHTFASKTSDITIELAERLIAMAPAPMSKVLFSNSGSEANDTAIKLIWYYNNARGRPDKKKIISRAKAYHGVTVATASLTGLPRNHQDFDLPIAGILHTSCPHHYRFGLPGESEEAFATRCADDLEKLILTEGPDTVAAFVGEPVMGAGGVIVPPATYWEKIQAVLTRYDVLLHIDEVICGFGRTGNTWGAQTYGIKPDMIACAKGLSAAYLPISALMMSDDIYQATVTESAKIGTFAHGFTYGGHPAAAAAALEAQKIYVEEGLFERARELSPQFQDGLRQFASHPLVGEVRGVGLVAGIELVKDKATREPFDPTVNIGLIAEKCCLDEGLILRPIGDTLAICPPLIISPTEIDQLQGCVGRALDATLEIARQKQYLA